ncbi:MAG: hypothetical protein DSY42_04800 [Aquifex sp.]|nr:MAG: hypothetical protein DSY42_04800 [Aquifex sp.]
MEVLARNFTDGFKFIIDYYNKNKLFIKETIREYKKAKEKLGVEVSSDGVVIGFGYVLSGEDPGSPLVPAPIILDEESRKRNFLGLGTIGSGKTYLAMMLLEYDVYAGKPVIFIDPKPSIEILNVVVWSVLEAGRHEDFRFMSFYHPEISYTINPLSRYFLPDELVSHLTSGIFVKDPFFLDVAKELTLVIVLFLYIKNILGENMNYITIKDVLQYMVRANFERLAEEFKELSFEIARKHKSLISYTNALENLIGLIKQSPVDYFSKVTTTLRVNLAQLSAGVAGKLLSNEDGENFCAEIEAGGRPVVFIQLASLLNPDITKRISRVIASMVRTLAGRVLGKGEKLNPPLSFIIDELANVLHLGFEESVNKAREAGVQYSAFAQTISKLSYEVGDKLLDDILGNFNTILSFSVPDEKTAQYVSQRIGTARRMSVAVRYSEKQMFQLNETEKYLVEPSMLMNLEPRHFYFRNYKYVAFGKTADFFVPPLEVERDVSIGIY